MCAHEPTHNCTDAGWLVRTRIVSNAQVPRQQADVPASRFTGWQLAHDTHCHHLSGLFQPNGNEEHSAVCAQGRSGGWLSVREQQPTPSSKVSNTKSRRTYVFTTMILTSACMCIFARVCGACCRSTYIITQAMLIQNRVKANEVTDDKSRIKQMETEILELKRKLAAQQASGGGAVSPARERWRLAKMVRTCVRTGTHVPVDRLVFSVNQPTNHAHTYIRS